MDETKDILTKVIEELTKETDQYNKRILDLSNGDLNKLMFYQGEICGLTSAILKLISERDKISENA